jgi:hypothetical protein
VPVDRVPVNVNAGIVTVPVNVGEAKSALVAIAVDIAVNSVSNSLPRITLPLSPEGKLSLAVNVSF